MFRQNISSNTPSEEQVGYSRAVRVDNFVFVAGTTATDENGNVVGVGNPYMQTEYIFNKIAKALEKADSSLEDVVRVRMFVTDIEDADQIGEVHKKYFGKIKPVATMVEVQRLWLPEHLIEIEVDAVIR
ncbi:MAG: RidA family protein [Ignavibacteriaceae bacterium]|nr:RidA family protein [Ignavibacteriaceae bacterium]NUM71632.1 RidA family protein [Ignavibacteriaceae bacterium]